ncbi:MAG TPA: hypothetical protein VHC68_03000 [Candidatus Paceibacterota bacterium]|nr:hypothetical protein [Candidatus Paceibacterota bacterium]
MNEITLDGKIYVSSKRAAEITGYAKDYVGQLCREGRVEARLIGRNWYVLKDAIQDRQFDTVESAKPADALQDTGNRSVSNNRDMPIANYKPQENADFPVLTRLEEPSAYLEGEKDEKSLPVASQDSWSEWFSTQETALPEPAEPAGFSQEQNAMPASHDEPQLQEQPDEPAQAVTLRRIREYQPKMDIEAPEALLEPVEAPKSPVARRIPSTWLYPAVEVASLLVIVGALALAGIGSGLYHSPVFENQANAVAGVSFYTKP